MKKIFAEQVFNALGNMSKEDLMCLSEQIINLMTDKHEDTSAYGIIEGNVTDNKMVCKDCSSNAVLKYGKDRNGHQRYKCRDCGKTFTIATDTVLANTKKPAYVWKNFIIATIKGSSLAASATECKISIPTAFVWRHKIYNAMNTTQGHTTFNGVVELDDTFVNVSYKGNHRRSKTFVMPRPAFRRGSDNRPKSQSERACVFCAIERGVKTFGVVPFCGLPNQENIAPILNDRFKDDAIVLTDCSHTYTKYFRENGIENITLKGAYGAGPTKKAPAVKGPYHINNINGLHRRFERFLEPFNGVSTKYLNNYLAYFVWLENQRICRASNLADRGAVEICRKGTALTAKNMLAWPAKPQISIAA